MGMKPHHYERILITNDDGIDAPGIEALAEMAKEFAPEIWIIAPQHDESGTGQSLSLHHPLRVYPRGERHWAVAGTPADCVAIGASYIMKRHPPSLILSGINAGSNTGDDVNLSGTLGAAFMGQMLGIPAIALSLSCVRRAQAKWETARAIGPKILRHFIETGWPENTCLSINIPDRPPEKITGFSWARQGIRTTTHIHVDRRIDMRDQDYFWMTLHDQEPDAKGIFDHEILHRGDVAVTALSLDRSVGVNLPRVVFDAPRSAVNE